MITVNMPVIGQDIPTGIVKEWLKKEGDSVSRDEVIATVESEKATFDVESPADGILIKILRHEDEEVEVLTPIAYINEKNSDIIEMPGHEIPAPETQTMNADISQHITTSAHQDINTSSNQRIFISPLAKSIAVQEGIDFTTITGSGLGGRIIKRNILDAVNAKNKISIDARRGSSTQKEEDSPAEASAHQHISTSTHHHAGEKEIPFNRIRQLIADKLSLSKQTVPHFYLFADVETDNALVIKEKLKTKNIHVTLTDFVIYAVAKTLKEYPLLNSHVFQSRYIQLQEFNIGLAVSTGEGLRVPVIPKADQDSLEGLSLRTKKIASDARAGKMDMSLKSGLTITTLGMYGIDSFLPIINPPEAAILAVGKSSPQVVTDGRNISIKNRMTITLACDHRLIDGDYAAQFLGSVKDKLENYKELNITMTSE